MKLLWIRWTVFLYETVEFIRVFFRFYSNKNFRQQDMSLLRSYLFVNPYKVSKRYLLDRGEQDPDVYGETPLTSLARIAEECEITQDDVVYELGCGRGRSCFWLANFMKCRVVGIEQIDYFVQKANEVVEKYHVDNLVVKKGDFFQLDLSDATVIYLFGTCMDDQSIEDLTQKFLKLPKGVKIITVSYPLTDYLLFDDDGRIEVLKTFEVSFNWGVADVYLQVTT